MGSKHKHRRRGRRSHPGSAPPASSAPRPSVPAPSAGSLPRHLELLMEAGKFKTALAKAKDFHKAQADEQSEQLLIRAYLGRIEQMREAGMHAEAQSLVAVVEHRYPQVRAQLDQEKLRLACRTGQLGPVLQQWQASDDPDQRRRLEDVLRREVADPAAIAACAAVAPDHPLRCAAAAVQQAFEAVTARRVSEADLALPEISRRSPLADWKSLVRAIAAFYRREDDLCRQLLGLIPADSAAARLVPVLQAMLADARNRPDLSAPEQNLAARICAWRDPLRESLEALDACYQDDSPPHRVFAAINRACRVCREHRPDLLEQLRKHISILSARAEHDVGPTIKALGGPAIHDAYWWRLWARFTEEIGSPLHSNCCWDRFCKHAVAENWFAADGPELALVYQRMIDRMRPYPADLLDEEKESLLKNLDFEGLYEDQPDYVKAVEQRYPRSAPSYCLDLRQICERLCRLAPTRPHYRQWLASCAGEDYRAGEKVAEVWLATFPDDTEPLLYLAESAEERGAFTKALKFIAQAEQAPGYEPRVKTARLRLLIAKAFRHARDGKAHLLEKDVAAIRALPQAQQGQNPLLLAAFDYLAGLIAKADTQAPYQRLTDLLDGPPGADAYLFAVCRAGGRYYDMGAVPKQRKAAQAGLPNLIAALSALHQTNVAYVLPLAWHNWLRDQLEKARSPLPLDPAVLSGFGQVVALNPSLAFHAARLMFHDDRCSVIDALALRGCSMSQAAYHRCRQCFRAAVELARRQGDTAKLAEVVEKFNHVGSRYFAWDDMEIDPQGMDNEELDSIITAEKKAKKLKVTPRDRFGPGGMGGWEMDEDDDGDDEEDFLPPRTRPRRCADDLPLFDACDDDDEDLPPPRGRRQPGPSLDGALEEILKQAPPGTLEALREYLEDADDDGFAAPPIELLEKLLPRIFGRGGRRRRR